MSSAWSPDGKHIAYSDLVGGVGEIFVFDASDGKNLKQLTRSGGAISPAWSPDSKQIIFWHHPGAVYVMDADGGNQKVLLKNEVGPTRAAWKPRTAFENNVGEVRKHRGGAGPIWNNDISPDGILYLGGFGGDPDPTRTVRVFETATGRKVNEFPGFLGRFTQDGKHLLVAKANGFTSYDISIYDALSGKFLRKVQGAGWFVWMNVAPDGKAFPSTCGSWQVTTGAFSAGLTIREPSGSSSVASSVRPESTWPVPRTTSTRRRATSMVSTTSDGPSPRLTHHG